MARRPPYRGKFVDPDKLRLQLAGCDLMRQQQAERQQAATAEEKHRYLQGEGLKIVEEAARMLKLPLQRSPAGDRWRKR
jgi:hypothetical protein